jgi:hypothetical protein
MDKSGGNEINQPQRKMKLYHLQENGQY